MKIDINEKERMALDSVKDIIKDHVKLLNEQTDISSHVEGILDLGNIYYTISGIIEKYEEENVFKVPPISFDQNKHNNQNIVSKEPNQAPTDHILTLAEKEKELHQRAIEELERLTNGEKHQYKYTFVRSNIGRIED